MFGFKPVGKKVFNGGTEATRYANKFNVKLTSPQSTDPFKGNMVVDGALSAFKAEVAKRTFDNKWKQTTFIVPVNGKDYTFRGKFPPIGAQGTVEWTVKKSGTNSETRFQFQLEGANSILGPKVGLNDIFHFKDGINQEEAQDIARALTSFREQFKSKLFDQNSKNSTDVKFEGFQFSYDFNEAEKDGYGWKLRVPQNISNELGIDDEFKVKIEPKTVSGDHEQRVDAPGIYQFSFKPITMLIDGSKVPCNVKMPDGREYQFNIEVSEGKKRRGKGVISYKIDENTVDTRIIDKKILDGFVKAFGEAMKKTQSNRRGNQPSVRIKLDEDGKEIQEPRYHDKVMFPVRGSVLDDANELLKNSPKIELDAPQKVERKTHEKSWQKRFLNVFRSIWRAFTAIFSRTPNKDIVRDETRKDVRNVQNFPISENDDNDDGFNTGFDVDNDQNIDDNFYEEINDDLEDNDIKNDNFGRETHRLGRGNNEKEDDIEYGQMAYGFNEWDSKRPEEEFVAEPSYKLNAGTWDTLLEEPQTYTEQERKRAYNEIDNEFGGFDPLSVRNFGREEQEKESGLHDIENFDQFVDHTEYDDFDAEWEKRHPAN